MALKLTRNRVIAGASMAMAATVAAVMLMSGESLPPQAQIIIGPQAPIGNSWYDTTEVERGKFHGRNYPAEPPASTDPAFDPYINNNYYDLGLGLAIAHQRTGDAEFLTLYRKVADSWWKSPHIGSGTVRTFDTFTHTPRNASLGGLILRAMDGRPEFWDWINSYTRAQFDNWVKTRANDPQLYLGVRDGAFMLQYATWLSRVLPDSFPLQAGGTATNGAALRAQYLADVEAVTTNYFGRLQQADGSWRWDDPYYVDPIDGSQLVGIMQPFQVGLLLDALIDVYDATGNAAVKASIVGQVTKACRHLYTDGPYSTQRLQALNVNLRGFHYFYHGGTTKNSAKYEKGDLPADWNPTDPSDVQNQRQPIGLLVAAYGWSYQRTGDRYFLDAGNELWDSAYGSTDGIHNYMAGDAKSYNQNCRWAGSYLVWSGSGASTPSPSASTTPSLTPAPISESPNNTRVPTAPEIVDSQSARWTRQPDGIILRNGQGTSGVGSQLLYCNRSVYAFGTDSQWYRWSDGWGGVGVVDPCGASPTPSVSPSQTPTPTPQPSPTVQPLPSPSPSPTVSPRPSPSPTLPICGPNAVIGDPARCLCVTGVKNNCRCR